MNLYYTMTRVINAIFHPYYRMQFLSVWGGVYDRLSDEEWVKEAYRRYKKKELNLDDPHTFCEKVQWLKVYDHNPEYIMMVDKYEAKKFAADILGEEHVIPAYGVWDNFDDIDFDKLPNQFVLKCTHDSGGFVICKDKSTFNIKKARRKLNARLKRNFYKNGRQWVYKDIKPRILAEKYIDTLGTKDSREYKLTCFDGKVGLITICGGIAHSAYSDRTNDNYDRDFNYLPFYAFYKNTHPIEKPKEMDEIIRISEALSQGIPQVRVDTYVIDGTIYFGEMTFYTWNGFITFTPEEWDEWLGDKIRLPEKRI